MWKRLVAVSAIFVGMAIAWFILGATIANRTRSSDRKLSDAVSGLWGSVQSQRSPSLSFSWEELRIVEEKVKDQSTGRETVVTREQWLTTQQPVLLDRSDLSVDFLLDQRKKGLLWYPTYAIDFDGLYSYEHVSAREGELTIVYQFPSKQASYDAFVFTVDGGEDVKLTPESTGDANIVRRIIPVQPGSVVTFRIAYRSRGLDSWRYAFGDTVSRVKDFRLSMTTNFRDIDFPGGTISPTATQDTPDGWDLTWEFENLVSGFEVGMEMPRKLNPGPLAAQISFFAPISLLFFFVWLFVISLLRGIDLHPVNYLFLGAAFFSFHLLFAYTVDHLDLMVAFATSATVSLFLVVSYLRLVVGARFAALEAGVSQLVYLVLFSYAHFFEGMTGLIVTIGSIATLFFLMQLTGRIRWSEIGAGVRTEGRVSPTRR
ncbi:MAG TPA: inner membrane CreD family protein [Vicinamibacteria bacterium]|jgi:hypothetical protein